MRAEPKTVTAEIGVFDQNGRSIGLARPQLSLAVAPGRRQAVVYDLLSRIDVRPGRYIVRASAHARERSLKGSVFGVLVAIAGCLRGMECGRSSAAVGWAATSAVVTGIVSIIVSDAVLTVIFDIIGL